MTDGRLSEAQSEFPTRNAAVIRLALPLGPHVWTYTSVYTHILYVIGIRLLVNNVKNITMIDDESLCFSLVQKVGNYVCVSVLLS